MYVISVDTCNYSLEYCRNVTVTNYALFLLVASAYTKNEIIFISSYCFYTRNYHMIHDMASKFQFPDSPAANN